MLTLNEFDGSYAKRTKFNCKTSDFTLAIAFNFGSAGEILTYHSARPRIYQLDINDYVEEPLIEVEEFCKKYRGYMCDTLHIAGNGAQTLYKHWGIQYQRRADATALSILTKAIKHCNIKKVYSGGQTGIDEAGIKAALKLGIPVEVNMPSGYKIRDHSGKDISMTKHQARKRFAI